MERFLSASLITAIFVVSAAVVPFTAFGAPGTAPAARVMRSQEILRQNSERSAGLRNERVESFHNIVIETTLLDAEQKTRLETSLAVYQDLFLTRQEMENLKAQIESFLADEGATYNVLSVEIISGTLQVNIS